MNICVLILGLFVTSLYAEAKDPKYVESIKESRVVLSELKGILLSGDYNPPPFYILQSVKGVEFYRSKLLLKRREGLQRELYEFAIGKLLTEKDIQEIRKRVEKYYEKWEEALVYVQIPENPIQNDILVINIVEASLGKLSLIGNSWFSDNFYLENLSLNTHQSIASKKIAQDVSWLNRSPWRNVSLNYKKADSLGFTDVEVVVEDKRPSCIYAGADNNGIVLIDKARVFTGFVWGDFLERDQMISYEYTASPDFETFQMHSLMYSAPLPWRHFFLSSMELAYSKNSEISSTQGVSWQIASRYIIPFPEIGKWTHDIRAGVDYKRTNNDLIVNETNISSTFVTILEGLVGYEGRYEAFSQSFSGKVEMFFQRFPFGEGMSKASYETFRSGAQNSYMYMRFAGEHLLSDVFNYGIGVSASMKGQISTGALLPLEQLGLGGFDTVRGYIERAVNVDNGCIMNLEVFSPKVSFVRNRYFGADALQAGAFLDFAYGSLAKREQEEAKEYFLLGVGPNVRYKFGNWLQSRIDLGFPLGKERVGAKVQLYFSAALSY